ncbi:MAG: hypothetical protein COB35_03880 [Gammaproteobacteria bacterium]|nr:MAG: hypothetical protein COB35_03880 [Gammaproteobacteria bacterium]
MKLLPAITLLLIGTAIGYFVSSALQSQPTKQTLIIEQEQIVDKVHKDQQPNVEIDQIAQAPKAIQKKLTATLVKAVENTSINAEKFKSLQEKNTQLEKQYKALTNSYRQSKQKVMMLARRLGDFDESKVTDDQLAALFPKEFAPLVSNFHGKTRDQIFDLHQQPEDQDWGFIMSNHLSDFITTHQYSNGVVLNSITCKNHYCEMLINEKEQPSWEIIFKEMTKQQWWKFTSTNSSSYDDKDGNAYIYYFMSAST